MSNELELDLCQDMLYSIVEYCAGGVSQAGEFGNHVKRKGSLRLKVPVACRDWFGRIQKPNGLRVCSMPEIGAMIHWYVQQ